jgi:LmbE family N-acetylglucosaminyl deacetylase
MVRNLLASAALLLLGTAVIPAQTTKLRVIAFGAHPDDCDIKFGGTAIKMARMGYAVKFVSVTNGDAGHHIMGRVELAQRRKAEAQESARRLGIAEYEILNNHDGELTPSVEVRRQIIRAIRNWKADIVLSPRNNDYHPDHRYTAVLVQDAAYMVGVPHICPDAPPLRKNPIFLYFEDRFQKPAPFRPDVKVSIEDVWEQKLNALDSHVSQFYEWLPWIDGEPAPSADPTARRKVLAAQRFRTYEAFELCEYGSQPSLEELRKLFPH